VVLDIWFYGKSSIKSPAKKADKTHI
jgi:hypothetical protein